jgi:predicted RNA-binding protein with PIN domain
MTLIIDGHNLIPKMPGMHLSDMDDETQLVQYIQEYCRRKRVKAEVFFDGSLPGSKSTAGGGMVHIHFVRKGKTADSAMIEYLEHQGKAARNCILVSSDRRVQTDARSLGSTVTSSEQFAAEVIDVLGQVEVYSKDEVPPLGSDEVEKWLKLFNNRKKNG